MLECWSAFTAGLKKVNVSYNVAVCQSLPEDDEAVWEWFQSVADENVEVAAPIFHELIDRLTVRFPCICDLEDEDDGVWSDGPLRGNIECRVPVLGMTYSRVDDVLPFLIQTANDLGLAVLDFQTCLLYTSPSPRDS